jgi:hypothetical protein
MFAGKDQNLKCKLKRGLYRVLTFQKNMMIKPSTSLHRYFEFIPDHRINRNKKHLLFDIIILAILAVICGAESWDSIELFGKTKLSFLKTFLKLPNGIPSHDTINRVFSATQPRLFEEAFIKVG